MPAPSPGTRSRVSSPTRWARGRRGPRTASKWRVAAMRLLPLYVLVLALAPAVATAQPNATESPVTLRWYRATSAVVASKGWTDTEGDFDRFPARARNELRKPVWDLSQHSAGLSVQFVSDATRIHVRWTVTEDRLALPHMPATGVSGLDLYANERGTWYFVGAARPTESPTNDAEVIVGLTPTPREFRLYLPLYNGVSRLEVGVPEEATLRFVP